MPDNAPLDPATLRGRFPVLERLAYLNAGTDGPLPDASVRAAAAELRSEAENGRTHRHFDRRKELSLSLRTAYASILGCPPEDIALTTCTSEGIALVIEGLSLASGDEIVTSDEEHPGLLGALSAAQALRGVQVRRVPWMEIAQAVGPRTRLVACSHVSWMTGRHAPVELAELDVPVLLDGAQGLGAAPTDVRALRCAAYAGAGQKWLCGPDGTGMLYVSPALRSQLAVGRRSYANMADPPSDPTVDLATLALHEDARRFDTYLLSAETLASALAAFEVLQAAGWDAVHERAQALAASLAEQLAARGRALAVPSAQERAGATLISFASSDPVAERERLAARGVLLRDIPGRPWLRASVGAWNDERDIARLIDALDPS
jgi:selenocysteine lyase/cysteine desulfurase